MGVTTTGICPSRTFRTGSSARLTRGALGRPSSSRFLRRSTLNDFASLLERVPTTSTLNCISEMVPTNESSPSSSALIFGTPGRTPSSISMVASMVVPASVPTTLTGNGGIGSTTRPSNSVPSSLIEILAVSGSGIGPPEMVNSQTPVRGSGPCSSTTTSSPSSSFCSISSPAAFFFLHSARLFSYFFHDSRYFLPWSISLEIPPSASSGWPLASSNSTETGCGTRCDRVLPDVLTTTAVAAPRCNLIGVSNWEVTPDLATRCSGSSDAPIRR